MESAPSFRPLLSILDSNWVDTVATKLEAIYRSVQNLRKNANEFQSYLNYYRRFIPNLAASCSPLFIQSGEDLLKFP